MRVIARSQEGGHYVDPLTIEANYFGNLEKLDKHFPMFDSVQIIDTSQTEHKVLAVIQQGITKSAISSELLPLWFRGNLPAITKKIKEVEAK
jgi:predicted ABC-type ATPase